MVLQGLERSGPSTSVDVSIRVLLLIRYKSEPWTGTGLEFEPWKPCRTFLFSYWFSLNDYCERLNDQGVVV